MPDIPLQEHLEKQLEMLDRYFEARLEAIKAEIHKAESQLAGRLNSMNEFRESLKDQSAAFLTRELYDAEHKIVVDRVSKIEVTQARIFAFAIGISFAVSALGVVLEKFFLK